jgi:hypothetical protein
MNQLANMQTSNNFTSGTKSTRQRHSPHPSLPHPFYNTVSNVESFKASRDSCPKQ